MPLELSHFIVHGKSDSDLLALHVNDQTHNVTIEAQDGSLGARFIRWITGKRSETNHSQREAAFQLYTSVLSATGHNQARTNLILDRAGIRVNKPITVRQVKQVAQGLGLVRQDYASKGAPLSNTRAQGKTFTVPTQQEFRDLKEAIHHLVPTFDINPLNQHTTALANHLRESVAANDVDFSLQLALLLQDLGNLEEQLHSLSREIQAGHVTGTPQEIQNLKDTLHRYRNRIENVIFNLNNAANARIYGTLDTTGNWNQVLYWQAAGIDFDRRMVEPQFEGKTVVDVNPLGEGAVNEVSRVTYSDGTEAAFKPIQFEYPTIKVAKYLGVSGSQPRNEVRNVAATRISEALGFNLMPKCGVGNVRGQQGLLAEVIDGDTAGKAGRLPPRDPHGSAIHRRDELISSPRAMKDINDLEVLDAILGMLDRHEGNWMIKTDAAGNYSGIAAIDNDQTLQDATVDLEAITGPRPRGFFDGGGPQVRSRLTGIRNVGLPMVIDARTAQTVLDPAVRERAFLAVSGMLEEKALEDLGKRWDTLAKHITEKLEPQGRVIQNWAARYDEVKDIFNRNVEHSLWGRAALTNDEIGNLLIMENQESYEH